MKNKLSIKNRVDGALSSIDNIQPATPAPYFYSKVLAKINSTKITLWDKWSAFFLRPTIAFATICFIIVINIFVLYSKIDTGTYTSDMAEVASLDEYNDAASALYELENEKP